MGDLYGWERVERSLSSLYVSNGRKPVLASAIASRLRQSEEDIEGDLRVLESFGEATETRLGWVPGSS